MYQHDRLLISCNLCRRTKSIIYGKLPGLSSGNYFAHLIHPVLCDKLIHQTKIALNAGDNDGIYVFIVLKMFKGMDYYRFIEYIQKLLRLVFGVHTAADSACENYAYIHFSSYFVTSYFL